MKKLPVLPLRDIVLFPQVVAPLFIGRSCSVLAMEAAIEADSDVLLVSQRQASDEEPTVEGLYEYGTIASVLQMLKLPDGTLKVLVEGKQRAHIETYHEGEKYWEADVTPLEEEIGDELEVRALMKSVKEQFDLYTELNKKILPEVSVSIMQIDDPAKLANIVSGHIGVKLEDKQKLLEASSVCTRLQYLYELIDSEVSVLQVEKKIKSRVKKQMEKSQREYYLNEQMRAIQRELGEADGEKSEYDEFYERIEETKLTDEAHEKVMLELKKLKLMNSISAEATVVRNYLDWVLALPWGKKARLKKDLVAAERILDERHSGLDKVKERILEYLAVQKKSSDIKGSVLCLVGPPGVGKTSLGQSIAKSMGREFVKISLGGLRDEAEIRGHRRTYIGSMPGRIVQGMRKVKTQNPVIFLDEIDKLSYDSRSDPSSALLEVLDPEQNSAFIDHYLEVGYDLSNCMFIATANSYNMPRPLLDRLEIIKVSGYTELEKMEIAKNHLFKKQLKFNGLKKGEFLLEEQALLDIIRYYTCEAGVRNLEREISRVMRKATRKIIMKEATSISVADDMLKDYLGPRKYKFGRIEDEHQIGMTTGLAWTEMGGDVLIIEAAKLPGKGKMVSTGKLGDVMKESIEAASSYVRSRSGQYGIPVNIFEKTDVHVHVPEGATPKDGPSAGVAMVTSIISCLTGNPVRKDLAMTGEVTLRGRVLMIGGLKEKLLAALRGGITTVCIPEENVKDLEEIPIEVKNNIDIVPVKHVDEVLEIALIEPLLPLPEVDLIDGSVANDSNDADKSGSSKNCH